MGLEVDRLSFPVLEAVSPRVRNRVLEYLQTHKLSLAGGGAWAKAPATRAKYCRDAEGRGSWLVRGTNRLWKAERAGATPARSIWGGELRTTHLARGYGLRAAAQAPGGHGRRRSPQTTRKGQSQPHSCSAGPSTEPRSTCSSALVSPSGALRRVERPCLQLQGRQGTPPAPLDRAWRPCSQ